MKCTLLPRPLSNDPRFIQCIYRYSHASKRFVEVYARLRGQNNLLHVIRHQIINRT